jgi:hypothetical protein
LGGCTDAVQFLKENSLIWQKDNKKKEN